MVIWKCKVNRIQMRLFDWHNIFFLDHFFSKYYVMLAMERDIEICLFLHSNRHLRNTIFEIINGDTEIILFTWFTTKETIVLIHQNIKSVAQTKFKETYMKIIGHFCLKHCNFVHFGLSLYRFPLSFWSTSIASNRALKFPAPKPWWLFLWMTSKKTVGLSCMVLVKICSR